MCDRHVQSQTMPQTRVTKGLALELVHLAHLMVRVPYWLDSDIHIAVVKLKLWKRRLRSKLLMLKPL